MLARIAIPSAASSSDQVSSPATTIPVSPAAAVTAMSTPVVTRSPDQIRASPVMIVKATSGMGTGSNRARPRASTTITTAVSTAAIAAAPHQPSSSRQRPPLSAVNSSKVASRRSGVRASLMLFRLP